MSFIPDEELKGKNSINLAPMIDFLFLMLAFFASLAISRIASRDTDLELVQIKPEAKSVTAQLNPDLHLVYLTVASDGTYKWVTDIRDYPVASAEQITSELTSQYENGLLPEDKQLTQVMLKIDKKASWDSILRVLFAVREAGFEVRPIYEPDSN